jgi:diaminopimelate decarboxylase
MNTKQPFERPFIKKISLGVPAKFGMKNKIEPIHSIDGVSVDSLHGSVSIALFVSSEKNNCQTHTEKGLSGHFQFDYPEVQLAGHIRTNYLMLYGRIFHQEGSWAEVVSGFEYRKALENEIPGEKIIFNGPSKQEEDLKLAIQNKSLIHIDHFDELFQLIELSKSSSIKPRVAIRINMNTGIYPSWDRFGFNYENGEAWEALNRIMLSNVLDLKGLHTHIGTYILEPSAYHAAASKLAEIADQLFAKVTTLRGIY